MTTPQSPCCFLDQNRVCEPTCMAFMRHESDADASKPPLMLKCGLLEGLNDLNAIARNLTGAPSEPMVNMTVNCSSCKQPVVTAQGGGYTCHSCGHTDKPPLGLV
jgi:hypothetical protein